MPTLREKVLDLEPIQIYYAPFTIHLTRLNLRPTGLTVKRTLECD